MMPPEPGRPLPLACLLPEAELAGRKQGAIAEAAAGAQQARELPDGYAFAFPGETGWLDKLAGLISVERACCPFFTFELICEAHAGPIWLRIRGPEGVKEFLRAELGLAAGQD